MLGSETDYVVYASYQSFGWRKHYIRYKFLKSKYFLYLKTYIFLQKFFKTFCFYNFVRKYDQIKQDKNILSPHFSLSKSIFLKDVLFLQQLQKLDIHTYFFVTKKKYKIFKSKTLEFKKFNVFFTGSNYLYINKNKSDFIYDSEFFKKNFKNIAFLKGSLQEGCKIYYFKINFFDLFFYLYLNNLLSYNRILMFLILIYKYT
jgi:hypothetical protein